MLSNKVSGILVLMLSLVSPWWQQPEKPPVPPDVLVGPRTKVVWVAATVLNEKQQLVTDLKGEDFTVYESEQARPIAFFEAENGPISAGVLVDNSGSMRPKLAPVAAGISSMVRSGDPGSEYFIVGFNDAAWVLQDFTSDGEKINKALQTMNPRGGTALYDAVIASADHLHAKGKNARKILLIVSDGGDNESRKSLSQTLDQVRNQGIMIYAIGLMKDSTSGRGRQALKKLVSESGGAAFFAGRDKEVEKSFDRFSKEMRGQYLIGYRPADPSGGNDHPKVKVVASAPGYKHLTVRAKIVEPGAKAASP